MTYSTNDTKKLIDVYTVNPCLETVDKLSVLLNRPRRSIISKLVKEGVYEAKGYRSKQGEIPVTKLALVRDIEDTLGFRMIGLDKAPKTTIKALRTAVIQMSNDLEDTLQELGDTVEMARVYKEMQDARTDALDQVAAEGGQGSTDD